MIQRVEITNSQRDFILKQNENHFLDFKSKRISPGKLTKSISAFSNSVGGELYIGIEDDKKWSGFADEEDANAHVQVFDSLFPLGTDFEYNFLSCKSEYGLVLKVAITKTKDIVSANDGKVYIRRSSQNLPIDNDEKLKRLQLDKGISSYEDNTVNIPIEVVTDSLSIFGFMCDVIPSSEPFLWMSKQLLIKNNLPIVAGVLLFSDTPQIALPKQSGIKIYRYKTKDLVGSRESLAFQPITIEGNIYNQIYSAVEEVTKIIEQIEIFKVGGNENVRYPNETLHEIIANAVIHRDYSILSDIHIKIFDNRIEVESPGKLPGHITVKNISREQFARNGKIVRLVNKFPNPPNKDIGEGLNTAFEAMKKLKLKEPIIVELENSVLVNIKHESLESPESIVMAYLEDNSTIKNGTARDLTGITSENSMKNIFYNLRDKQLIEQVPGTGGSGSKWQKKNSQSTLLRLPFPDDTPEDAPI
jgi:ATP-dependent DNA helicase RecG